MKTKFSKWRWFAAIGFGLLSLGALGLAIFCGYSFDPKNLEEYLQSELALIPGSQAYEGWRAPTVPLYFEIFMFNWTNAEKFPQEKPNLEQLGPYRFREHREHVNVTRNMAEHTLSYNTFRSWQFDQASSNGSLDDVITTVDFLLNAALQELKPKGYFINMLFRLTIAIHRKLFIRRTARELLFEGFSDPLLFANQFLNLGPPGAPSPDKFGWFYERNNTLTTDGYMEVTTGEDSGSLPGQIVRWNHDDHLKYYQGQCSRLAGSAGEFVPRNLTEDSNLEMFIPDLCRTVVMPFMNTGNYEGLKYLKYGLAPSSFDSSRSPADNTCFCNGPCDWGGVMNVSACRFNAPIFVSLPHFLQGDPRLGKQLTGLNPDPEKHSFYFAIEPKMGIPLEVAARFQVNVYMELDDKTYRGAPPKLLFPIFWVQQKVVVDQSIVNQLVFLHLLLDYGAIVCVGTALFFAVLATAATCCCRERPEFTKPSERWWRFKNIRERSRIAKAGKLFLNTNNEGGMPVTDQTTKEDVNVNDARETVVCENNKLLS